MATHEDIGRLPSAEKQEGARPHRMTLFVRPNRGIAGLISRPLPPLPAFTPVWYLTKEELRQRRSYRLAAFGLFIAAVGVLFTLAATVPWMRISPATLIFGLTNTLFGGLWGTIVGFAVIIMLMVAIGGSGGTAPAVFRWGSDVKFWDAAAMYEEQWFRTGAENWSAGQRIYATMAFGAVHVMNIIYPIASLLVVTLIGAVFMAAYLCVYRQTGNRQLATFASAKLHATYNRFAVAYMVIALAIVLGASFFL